MEHLNDINLEIPLGSRKLFWLSFKILRIVKIYIKLRFILILGYIAEGVLIVETDYGCNLPSIVYNINNSQSRSCDWRINSFIFILYLRILRGRAHQSQEFDHDAEVRLQKNTNRVYFINVCAFSQNFIKYFFQWLCFFHVRLPTLSQLLRQ